MRAKKVFDWMFYRFSHCCDDENLKNDTAVKYELVLRKWEELNPAYEFRCFVKNNTVVGRFMTFNVLEWCFLGK